MFDLRLDSVAEWIRRKRFSSVAIQMPEGLRMNAIDIANAISSKTGVNVLIIGDPCYGACDVHVKYNEFADGLIHFGHSPMSSVTDDDNILFVEAAVNIDIKDGIAKIASSLPERIGLIASVQYINALKDAKDVLESMGKKAVTGKGDTRLRYEGQILGCNCSSAESIAKDVDILLYIGEGSFHPLAAALGTGTEVMRYDPVTSKLDPMNEVRDRIMRKRFATIENAKSANSFLIIISAKAGQRRDAVADEITKKIISEGRKAFKVVMNEITPDALISYKVDAYVSTACPRLAIDDSVRYGKPMLTPQEAEIAIGMCEWDDYEFDAICD
jgi:2-(3-amino-3-carboxypropyl)histidine synthase